MVVPEIFTGANFVSRLRREMIEVHNLSKTFRVHRKQAGLKESLRSLFVRDWLNVEALKNVSLKVEAGEIVGLLGANGAGKTTLVKILAGIIHPTSGSATVQGFEPFKRHNDFRRQIALIMGQKAQLWWDLPAGDSFLLLREIYRIPQADFAANLEKLADALEVADKLDIQVRRLSLGERMKMELIAALLHSPKVVFLDEPTIGLDFSAQRAIREFLLRYRKEHMPAMILTSHYMEDIERLCKRIVIIRQGEIVYDGSLARVVAEHARHKILRVTLMPDTNGVVHYPDFPPTFGEIIEKETHSVVFKVERARAAEAAAWVLENFPVVDLNIDEEDAAAIVESMMRKHTRV